MSWSNGYETKPLIWKGQEDLKAWGEISSWCFPPWLWIFNVTLYLCLCLNSWTSSWKHPPCFCLISFQASIIHHLIWVTMVINLLTIKWPSHKEHKDLRRVICSTLQKGAEFFLSTSATSPCLDLTNIFRPRKWNLLRTKLVSVVFLWGRRNSFS